MNKHRSKKRKLTLGETTLLICAGLISVGAGISHAWFKTEEVKVQRLIKKTHDDASDLNAKINGLQADITVELSKLQTEAIAMVFFSKSETTPASRLNHILPFSGMAPAKESGSPDLAQVP